MTSSDSASYRTALSTQTVVAVHSQRDSAVNSHPVDDEKQVGLEHAGFNLGYKLPEVVESLRRGRVDSCSAAAVVSALFAGVEASMINTIKASSSPPPGSHSANQLLLVLSYAALILNASTTFTSLLLIDRLGDVAFRSQGLDPEITETARRSGRRLLGRYGASGVVWDLVELHYFITLLAGSFTIFFQLITYIFIQEGLTVAIVSACCTVFAILPLFVSLISPL
ncbi:hypothetical protein FRB96_005127 [Tulasnella sp. 330]|nr:hypothetical protein FRB96_005127 [Tulasnella sp. 330]KAG8887273.1 hypothetical protein FRB98_000310 [Tulasnella sp. 332]